MKYKVGDEVLVKAKIIDRLELWNGIVLVAIELKSGRKIFYVNIDDLTSVKTNNSQDMTAEEAWEIARKICPRDSESGFNSLEAYEIFSHYYPGIILGEYTPQQAKEKIEAWEESKKFRIGDVVEKINETDRPRGVVVAEFKKEVYVVHEDFTRSYFEKEEIRKTGETIDIEAFQKQIRGE
jgi:hypothetical protein